MRNLEVYDACRAVPKEAKKEISAGRLKGMTDINPMWRIKKLTELFGPCGVGWKYTIREKRLEQLGFSEAAAFVDIDLYIKLDGEWSEAIPGTGGSMFVAQEKNGLHMSDECFKMALTDAISVACKALGFGADVYWEKDRTKYGATASERAAEETAGHRLRRYLAGYKKVSGLTEAEIFYAIKSDTGLDLHRQDLTDQEILTATNWVIAAGQALKAAQAG